MKRLVLILTSILLFAAGCASCGYTVIDTKTRFAKPANGAKVFNSPKEYSAFLMARAVKKVDIIESFDFSSNSLLVVYLGKKAGEGFGLEITDVNTNGDIIVVTAKETSPDMKKPSQYFIKIGKTTKKAKLVIK